MKMTLLLDNSRHSVISRVVQIITEVLQELEVDVQCIDLCSLPYFLGNKTREMDEVINCIEESKGVIAITQVSLVGIHAAMQSFFDHMSISEKRLENKPLLAIAYSEWMGELEATQMISKAWSILGGYTGGTIGLNSYMNLEQIIKPIEREIENFYRIMKQQRETFLCTERYYYLNKEKLSGLDEERQTVQDFGYIFEQLTKKKKVELERSLNPIDPEMKILLKDPMDLTEEKIEYTKTGIYSKPNKRIEKSNAIKKIKNLPHYFIAKHDKELDIVVQYVILDTQEKAYLIIKEGNCECYEGVSDTPTLEINLAEEVLNQIIKNTLTYQKAFMVGKLKVKGNFTTVAKLDQIFKFL